ncbi:PD-(D/E)XK motif protein [Pseudalkalibacillus sp. Hm43]|uniref:PD-(D/E)XK motif protein n=1 Tax=Pseudalkalibacillus sp. Hm43 TaxID=3450742 RepID=UPI003F4237D9
MKIEVVTDKWNDLDKNIPTYGSLNAKYLLENRDVLIGIDYQGLRHLLIGIENIEDSIKDTKSRGITVEGKKLVINQDPERLFLDIVCTDPKGNNLFNLVIIDIINLLKSGNNPKIAVSKVINKWRSFWGKVNEAILTEERIIGLFGELWFLLVWLLPKNKNYLKYWSGPTGSRNDFELPNIGIEVKSTTSIKGHVHSINGLDQLLIPQNGNLYFYSLRCRKEGSSTNTLDSLINKVRDLISNDEELLELFEIRLAQAGYFEAHKEKYDSFRFRIIEERLYEVDDLFPKLSTDSFVTFPEGIEKVSYVINLDTSRSPIIATTPSNFF